jgi:AraC-like DNA-binding protein
MSATYGNIRIIDLMNYPVAEDLIIGQSGFAAYPPGATFGPRMLNDFEFVWIVEGNATASFDGVAMDAPRGTVLLGRPGVTDRYDWDPERRTIQAFFHFSFDYSTPGWPALKDWPVVRRMGSEDILRSLFRYVIGHTQSRPGTATALLEGAVTLMLRAFLEGQTNIALEPADNLPPPVQLALAAIRTALAQDPPAPIALKDLARAAHVAPEYLCRVFRRHLNLGPLECAGLARLERAAALLIRSNLPVRQIADAVGFASPYHFSAKFRKIYGLSPRDYRLSMQSGFLITGNPVIQHLQFPVGRD